MNRTSVRQEANKNENLSHNKRDLIVMRACVCVCKRDRVSVCGWVRERECLCV